MYIFNFVTFNFLSVIESEKNHDFEMEKKRGIRMSLHETMIPLFSSNLLNFVKLLRTIFIVNPLNSLLQFKI